MSWPAGLLWQPGFSWPADLLWRAGFLWRAGLPRAGLRSSPTPPTVDISGTPRQQGLGRLRHPARGKPARHRDGGSRSGFFGKFTVGGSSTTGLLCPADFLWRAGLPRAGLRSSPTPTAVDISGTPRQQGLGRLRHPARGKPARHRGGGSRAGFFGNFAAGGSSTTGLLWPADFLWRAGLPRAGLRSSPNKPTPVSPGTPRKQALGRLRHPTGDKPPLHIYRASPPTAARAPVVASGLAPRWAAQQPHSRRRRYFWHTAPVGFGAASPPSAGQARSPQGGV